MFEKEFEQFMKSMGLDTSQISYLTLKKDNVDYDCDCGDNCDCAPSCECGTNMKPQVYGFRMYMGPDGIPHIQEYGNTKNGLISKRKDWQVPKIPMASGMEQQKPNIEIIENATKNGGKIIIEMPGLEKTDIKITVRDSKMFISASRENVSTKRAYNEKVSLPAYVDSKTIKATYTNGILEITFEYNKNVESRSIDIQ